MKIFHIFRYWWSWPVCRPNSKEPSKAENPIGEKEKWVVYSFIHLRYFLNHHILLQLSRLAEEPRNPDQSTINYFGRMKENRPYFEEALDNILIPRVPGTEGSRRVREVRKDMTNSLAQ